VRQVDGLTNLMDIPATCAGLAGASPFPGEGHDLTAVLAGTAAAPRRHGYAELGYARAIFQDGFRYLALRPSALARGLSRDERQQRLDAANAELTRQGKVIFNTDPMAPFGHLMLVPGGGHVEQVAIQAHQSVYFETDQLYDTANDPAEQRNLIHDPAQGPRLARLRDLLRRELAARGDAFPLDP
jgi:arylsulfatase A-like enzyme